MSEFEALLRSNLVPVPCAVCKTPVRCAPFFAADHRRHLVRCSEHVTPPPDDATPMTIQESWRRSAGTFADASIDGIPSANVRRWITMFADRWPDRLPDGAPSGILLGGPTGVRKTGACYALLNSLVHARRVHPNEILVVREEEFLPPLAQVSRFPRAGAAGRTKDALNTALAAKRILLLDDLGYGRYPTAEDRASIMLGLLERVEKRNILLLVTTNISRVADLEQLLGPAAYSRVWDRCGRAIWTPGDTDTRLNERHQPAPGSGRALTVVRTHEAGDAS